MLSHDAGIFGRLSLERTFDRRALLIELQRIGDFLHLVIGQAGIEQRRRFEQGRRARGLVLRAEKTPPKTSIAVGDWVHALRRD